MRVNEIICEGGWASTLTQGTTITPQVVDGVMKQLFSQFIPQLNKFLEAKGLQPTEISAPGGSATYYQRDLKQDPTREYGDVDVQFHIPRIPNVTNNANADIYRKAVKEFCDSSPNYSTENGSNVILQLGNEHVQVDLIMSYFENKNWIKALAPEYRIKGVLCNSLYSSLGEALNLSIGGGHGVQVKTQGGNVVPFRTTKNVELKTITNDPKTWAIAIARFLGCAKLSDTLKAYPGMKDEIKVADIINSIKGIADTLELNGNGDAKSLLSHVKSIYLEKINKAATSSKFDKASSPEAVAKAEHTKEMLLTKSAEIARLFD